ncbi:hypothetical protein F475_01783 [Pseudomonas sp. URMO17WK12:I6]|uniref:hypothetical protein n=1 Tax=Pseudomonas sp. URMO17WK12:I6 TaxID=1261629 RepID=UPI000DB6E637|nr:hypothetical protein [Pseudomonas sp. URMO17WK12:I6]PZW63161.1 hypothetical protein F475_01783 [Pseudomonas sp. URMO17WK12:I6]
MKIVKGALFVILVVALAVGAFNLIFVTVSGYFGPFYESEADQSRNFAIWLLGNAGVGLLSVVMGVVLYRRYLRHANTTNTTNTTNT